MYRFKSFLNSDVTYEPETRAGVANLIEICAALTETEPMDLVSEQHWLNMSALKKYTVDVLVDQIVPIGNRIKEGLADPDVRGFACQYSVCFIYIYIYILIFFLCL
jgi:hypothetical protein